MSSTPAAYDGNQIKVLRGLEAVRKRPGMYIGDTQKKAFHHMMWEILDNSIVEHIGGHCDRMKMRMHAGCWASGVILINLDAGQRLASATTAVRDMNSESEATGGSDEGGAIAEVAQ